MCGRYVRRSDKQKIAEHFHVHGPSLPDFGPSWNVAPQTFQPIVRLNRETGDRELVLMRWGLVPYWARDEKIGLRTINAKAETITTTPAFREAIKYRRLASRGRHKACPYARSVMQILSVVAADHNGIDSELTWNSHRSRTLG